jgi:hypothetical protein
MTIRVILKASNVAAMVGRHRYKPRSEVLDELVKKYAPEKFTGKTKEDKAVEALAFSVEAQAVLKSAIKIEAKNSGQVQEVFRAAQKAINFDSKLNNEQKAEVIDHLRSKVYTTHGIRSEDKTADTVEELKTEVEEVKKQHKVAEIAAKAAESNAVQAVAAVAPLIIAVKTAETAMVQAVAAVAPLVVAFKKAEKNYKKAVKDNSGIEEARKLKEDTERKEREAREEARLALLKKEELEKKEQEARKKAEIAQELRDAADATERKWKDMLDKKSAVADKLPGNLIRDDNFYNFFVCEIDGIRYVICGKIDRIEERPDGSRVLVEIKNRTNRLFNSVPEYEFIQVQVYLQMLGLVHARLVEQYNNQVKSHDVDRDEETWVNEILPELQKFCEELHLKIT